VACGKNQTRGGNEVWVSQFCKSKNFQKPTCWVNDQ
jgi:hypothetical protein